MFGVRRLSLKERALDRRYGYRAGHRPLLFLAGLSCPSNGGKFGNGRMLEQLLWCEPQIGVVSPGHDLDTQYRISTQFKEVVINTNPFRPQYRRPNLDQFFFPRITWGDIPLSSL